MEEQEKLDIQVEKKMNTVEEYQFEPIKGYPMLHWKGKRPFNSTQFYPAQLKENYGEEVNGWMNKIFWGDNLQVMSHLLKEFRGKVDLVYIDPPFDSRLEYKKKIKLKKKQVFSDINSFEEKQYTDLWSNDAYLQFVYERLVLIRELLSEEGSVFFHCDFHREHYIKCIMDEVFGEENFKNQIIWQRTSSHSDTKNKLSTNTDSILYYSKTNNAIFNYLFQPYDEKYLSQFYKYKDDDGRVYRISDLCSPNPRPNLYYEYKGYLPNDNGWAVSIEKMKTLDEENRLVFPKSKTGRMMRKTYLDERQGVVLGNVWTDINPVQPFSKERTDYPTQKPLALIERIINIASKPESIVLDCFMGSGGVQEASMRLGRKFIGADINLGAIETTIKRLNETQKKIKNSNHQIEFEDIDGEKNIIKNYYTGFSVYNVNNYEVFRNPVEAKELLKQALEIQPLPNNTIYDGEKDGRMVKIMPVNRIATRADLNELISGFNIKSFEKKFETSPNKPVESLLLVCMGHEADLGASLQKEMHPYKLDIEVVDILRDKSNLEFKRDSEAEIRIENGKLIIRQFYPMNLLQKLSIMKENVEDWKELTESVKVDFNYDGVVFEPKIVDVPEKEAMVKGEYLIPEDAGTIRIKNTDLLSESLELTIEN